ncbi:hypothetical protein ASPACDRAFT_76435 [Aspergillus aculeatus ATCC 16872]|uniref:Rhodopsin domain-containing protein n=1 Tax=Aspergillus aculeatus (strain ATCC 16872 / CBS 172.66 / WB 5094) TaxID=690307 RepID=A0A1L9X090_ASPA1|nr:uncharacterized protein ASPACDRAFT_76435 [Aspergillus aculeatus ATCC 16872]OJK01932.1 hypothetical protein ASPACDRAFT_76435 [Aspergillus aculeatus ATCC 16872]
MGYNKGEMIALGFILMFVPAIFVGLRVWARRLCGAQMGSDDYTIFAALLFCTAVCICQLIGAIDGQLGQTQATYPNGEPILDDPRFLTYERAKFALHMLSVMGVGLSKASVILLYMRIFHTRTFRRVCQLFLGLAIAWTAVMFFVCLFQCYPVTALVEGFYGNKCINTMVFYNGLSGSDVVLDVCVLLLPIPMVLRVKLEVRQKAAVLGMFLLGALAVASSIARLAAFIECERVLLIHYNNETYYTSGVFIWTVVELALAIISACLPTLRPLFFYRSRGGLPTGDTFKLAHEYHDHIPSRQARYGRPTDTIDELEVAVPSDRSGPPASVQIQIQRTSSHERGHPTDGVIVVEHSTTWTDVEAFKTDIAIAK